MPCIISHSPVLFVSLLSFFCSASHLHKKISRAWPERRSHLCESDVLNGCNTDATRMIWDDLRWSEMIWDDLRWSEMIWAYLKTVSKCYRLIRSACFYQELEICRSLYGSEMAQKPRNSQPHLIWSWQMWVVPGCRDFDKFVLLHPTIKAWAGGWSGLFSHKAIGFGWRSKWSKNV